MLNRSPSLKDRLASQEVERQKALVIPKLKKDKKVQKVGGKSKQKKYG